MRSYISLVPQDDHFTPAVTSKEAILDAAAFKTNLSGGDAQACAEELLVQFGLEKCNDVECRKGCLGDPKKRLSIALECMGSPSALFCTSPQVVRAERKWRGRLWYNRLRSMNFVLLLSFPQICHSV
jgi:ABC-type multidrug transport system ATPase subunit